MSQFLLLGSLTLLHFENDFLCSNYFLLTEHKNAHYEKTIRDRDSRFEASNPPYANCVVYEISRLYHYLVQRELGIRYRTLNFQNTHRA